MSFLEDSRPVVVHDPTMELIRTYLKEFGNRGAIHGKPICGEEHAMWELYSFWQLSVPFHPTWREVDLDLASAVMSRLN